MHNCKTDVKFLDDSADRFDFGQSSLLEARWERRKLEGWSYFGSFTRSGEDFVPDMGFIRRRNYTEVAGLLHWNRFPGTDSPFQRTMFVHLDGFTAFRNEDGTVESAAVNYIPMVWLKDGSSLMLLAQLNYESLRSPIGFINAATVDAGDYVFGAASASYMTSTRNRYRFMVSADAGRFYDGRRLGVGISPEWNPSPHFQLSGSYSLTSVRFVDAGFARAG